MFDKENSLDIASTVSFDGLDYRIAIELIVTN